MRRSLVLLLALSAGVFFAGNAFAADDPSIQEPLRGKIQSAMKTYIEGATVDGAIHHYDPVTDSVLTLRDANLHAGIVKKGDFYVSCADFIDQKGRKVDLDYLVVRDGDGVIAVQGFVHKVDGEKRPYHLED